MRFLALAALALLSSPALAQASSRLPELMVPYDLLTVGPAGDYANIQDAIDAVIVGTITEIRVQDHQTYTENLSIPAWFTSGSITLSGGWESTFAIQNDDTEDTIIDGNGGGVLDISIGGGILVVEAFTLTNGLASQGAGVFIMPSGNAQVFLNKILVIGNTATTAADALGGGLWAILGGSQWLEIRDSLFFENQAVSTGGGLALAGGVGINAAGGSRVVIDGVMVVENYAESSGAVSGGGLFLQIEDAAEADLLDITVSGNTGDSGSGDVSGVGGWWSTSDSAVLRVERVGCAFNAGVGGDTGPQIISTHSGLSTVRMSEIGLVQGEADGLVLNASGSSTVNLVNLTVADNLGTGLDLMKIGGTATLTLYNTIAFGNGVNFTDWGTGVDAGSNLIGVDPLFVNPSEIDYHLMPGSAAFDAGDNTPPGGLGSNDFDGRPRIADGTVDIGVFEGPIVILIDGFESGDTTGWSSSVP